MSLRDLARLALSNLWRRKLRTFLTILAVVIGATLVTLMVSLGVGTQDFLLSQLRSLMPAESIYVSSSQRLITGGLGGMGVGGPAEELEEELRPLSPQEIAALQALEGVERVDLMPMVIAQSLKLEGAEKKYRPDVTPAPAYEARRRKLVAGQPYQEGEGGKAILANQYLDAFGWASAEEALGQRVIITVRQGGGFFPLLTAGQRLPERDYLFEVVGVTEKTLASLEVIIPLEDAKEMSRFANNNPDLYTEANPGYILQVKLSHPQYSEGVARKIRDMGLGALTAEEMLGTLGNVFGIMQVALSLFGLIALGVASLGIINTLVMAIYERTREIGVMKAVGASKRTIRLLFTAEGGLIGLIGGTVGAILGLVLGLVLNKVAHVTFLKDFPTFNLSSFPLWLLLGVIALATLIALLAALYPANRAARLDPVEALRYE